MTHRTHGFAFEIYFWFPAAWNFPVGFGINQGFQLTATVTALCPWEGARSGCSLVLTAEACTAWSWAEQMWAAPTSVQVSAWQRCLTWLLLCK